MAGCSAKNDGRPRDRRVVRTKKAIREALLALVREKGYDKVTIAAIARKADIDRKTFYLHYDSVDEVVEEMLREHADKTVALLRDESLGPGVGVDVADLFARLSVLFAHDPSIDDRMMRHIQPDILLDKIEGALVEAIVEKDALGLASTMGPDLMGYYVSFFCAGLLAMYRRRLFSDSEIPLGDLASMASTAFLSGVEGVLREVPREAVAARA